MAWKFYAQQFDYNRQLNLHIADVLPDGRYAEVQPMVLTVVPEHQAAGSPALDGFRAEEFLRAALNCAWELGLRPDGFNDTRESMAATKAHLEDFRKLTFYLMENPPALKVDALVDELRKLAPQGGRRERED